MSFKATKHWVVMGFSTWLFILPALLAQAQPKDSSSSWKSEWENVLAAAKKEGKVVVWTQAGSNVRQALVEGFEKAFPGIQVEFVGASGSKLAVRLLAERRAGVYSVDIFIHGTTTTLESLLPEKALDPIPPLLILPEAKDPSKWLHNRLDFADKEAKYNLAFFGSVKTPMAINPDLVKPGEIRSYWDLMAPKWTGKLAMRDPTEAGPGLATATFWYAKSGLGKEFIRQLFSKQKVALSSNDRQLLEWLTQGRYAVLISPSETAATGLKAKGLRLEFVGAEELKEGSYLTAGNGSVALINRAPHPNAVKVYLNWLLTREAQTLASQMIGHVSRRLDVPRGHLEPSLIPKEGVEYQPNYKEEYVRLRDEVLALLKEVLKN